jgi:hypothetical protein
MIVLSDGFYREISSHPIPTDLEAAKAFPGSPAAIGPFHVAFLPKSYRERETVPLFGEAGLVNQLGIVDYCRPRKFRAKLEKWLGSH